MRFPIYDFGWKIIHRFTLRVNKNENPVLSQVKVPRAEGQEEELKTRMRQN